MAISCVLLLGAMAVFPLLPWTEPWWEDNLHRSCVAAVLGVRTLLYHLFLHPHMVVAHWPGHACVEPSSGPVNFGRTGTVLAKATASGYHG